MKNGICSKCESRDVHVYDKAAIEMSIAISMFNSASLIYYICTNCGYVELFVKNRESLPLIAEKYPKVG